MRDAASVIAIALVLSLGAVVLAWLSVRIGREFLDIDRSSEYIRWNVRNARAGALLVAAGMLWTGGRMVWSLWSR